MCIFLPIAPRRRRSGSAMASRPSAAANSTRHSRESGYPLRIGTDLRCVNRTVRAVRPRFREAGKYLRRAVGRIHVTPSLRAGVPADAIRGAILRAGRPARPVNAARFLLNRRHRC